MSREDQQHAAVTPINADGLFISSYTLGIIYAVVARGTTVLAHHACCHGNFSEVARQVLRIINSEENSMMTYASGDYMYHYISEDGVIYMCITDDEFERSKAFLFLNLIKERFQSAYQETVQSALPFAMNTEFALELAKEMKNFSEESSLNLLPVENGIRLENIGVRDLDLVEDEGMEQLELLRSDSVSVKSFEALISPRSRAKCCLCLKRNWKTLVVIFIIILVVVVLVVALYLGVCLSRERDKC